MLSKDDLKDIKNLLKPLETGQKKLEEGQQKLEEGLRINTSSTLKIERDIKAALELRIDVSQFREQVKNHEGRITQLENL